MHSESEILRASASWVWFPRDSETEGEHLQLVRYPARSSAPILARCGFAAYGEDRSYVLEV
jgi:hypothetical protein